MGKTKSLKILITNIAMRSRTGTEMYIRDLGMELLRQGHRPVVYTTKIGTMAEEIRRATVPVIDDLDNIGFVPDIIHGHHIQETMTALLRFPRVPAVFVCHDWSAWHDVPPIFPRVHYFIAVDETCKDRLECEFGIPESKIKVIHNFVNMALFKPRPKPLPGKPQRALIFSNNSSANSHVDTIKRACKQRGITIDVVGKQSGFATNQPEQLLPNFDMVFAKGKSALEAMAVGAAVVLCDKCGAGPMITAKELDLLRRYNFGRRVLDKPITVDYLLSQIDRYDSSDATVVSQKIRSTSDDETAIENLIELYLQVIQIEQDRSDQKDYEAELVAASNIFKLWGKSEMTSAEFFSHFKNLSFKELILNKIKSRFN